MMLDILIAVLLTGWVLVLFWQVVRRAVSQRALSRLSGNSRLVAAYFRVSKIVQAGSVGVAIVAGFLLVLYLENSPGITLWDVWAVAVLVAGGYLVSRRLAQTASAAEKGGAAIQLQAK